MRKLLGVLAIALTALAAVQVAAAASSSPWLNGIATWLAQKPVTVKCLTVEEAQEDVTISVWGASAYVEGWTDGKGQWHPSRQTVFAPEICDALLDFRAGDASEHTVADLAWAILVITHESGHLRGWRWAGDEALTQCWAMRHFKPVAARVGVTDPVNRDFLYRFAYEWHKQMPSVYHDNCSVPKP